MEKSAFKENTELLNTRLAERGVKKRHLPAVIAGYFFRTLDLRVPRDTKVISLDPKQNERSKNIGYIAPVAVMLASIVGIESYNAIQKGHRETRECSIENIAEAGFTPDIRPTIRETEQLVLPCIPVDIQTSTVVASEAEAALEQMGIEPIFFAD